MASQQPSMASEAAASSASKALTIPTATVTTGFALPFVYRLFFFFIEPVSALVGAYYANYAKLEYLRLTHASSVPSPIPVGTSIVMSQLANMYLLFAINEWLVLRSTNDLRVWKRVLFCLLIGDIGHLYTVRELGPQIYWSVTKWNAIDWGNIPFVYLGASLRMAFLANVGLGVKSRKLKRNE
ncbi:hypothetical protein B0H63DRAFT_79088 [Podospora didyma]|uniref:DUF7704 domain-containing protein n=1 Tax=Podospora didyma TaxID=330526 RepID=A0AAE0K283_9PEZI|nr:hypothetical protein B0H63DRAFT_79088 [Podospora didyma]